MPTGLLLDTDDFGIPRISIHLHFVGSLYYRPGADENDLNVHPSAENPEKRNAKKVWMSFFEHAANRSLIVRWACSGDSAYFRVDSKLLPLPCCVSCDLDISNHQESWIVLGTLAATWQKFLSIDFMSSCVATWSGSWEPGNTSQIWYNLEQAQRRDMADLYGCTQEIPGTLIWLVGRRRCHEQISRKWWNHLTITNNLTSDTLALLPWHSVKWTVMCHCTIHSSLFGARWAGRRRF